MKDKILSMFYWIKNKKTIEKEQISEDEQYQNLLIKQYELEKQISKLEKEKEHQEHLKEIYLCRCRNLKRKLMSYESQKARTNS